MGPLGVVEPDPFADDPLGVEAVGQLVQVNRLVLERAPQSLNEDVVHAPAAPVHGDRGPGLLEAAGDLEAGELAALVGVEDLRPAGGVERLIQGLDAEPRIHGVRQPPGQDPAARPVHHRNQVKEAAPERDVGDVGAPDMVGALDGEALETVRIDPVFGMGRARLRRPVDRLQPHQAHEAPNPVTADDTPLAAQMTGHLTGPIERMFKEQLVDAPHQRQVGRALAPQPVIER